MFPFPPSEIMQRAKRFPPSTDLRRMFFEFASPFSSPTSSFCLLPLFLFFFCIFLPEENAPLSVCYRGIWMVPGLSPLPSELPLSFVRATLLPLVFPRTRGVPIVSPLPDLFIGENPSLLVFPFFPWRSSPGPFCIVDACAPSFSPFLNFCEVLFMENLYFATRRMDCPFFPYLVDSTSPS